MNPSDFFADETDGPAVPLILVDAPGLERWLAAAPAAARAWLAATAFEPKAGTVQALPGEAGALSAMLAGVGRPLGTWSLAALAERLPAGTYRLAGEEGAGAQPALLGWALAQYRFTRYRADSRPPRRLVWPAPCDRGEVLRAAEATFLARDLINTPPSDLGPAELAEAVSLLAQRHGAECTVIAGDDLLGQGYPTVHMVGRASSRAPCLADLRWGPEDAPKVTLVGKGVCFDTGGLDLKTAAGMLLMKKDMGGAAIVLGLASMIMAAKLPVRLRVLVPAVENAVSGDAMRPSDVVRTRKGLTVEIGNTDAEGRLILCDALAEADSENPALIVDCATLTGAARVALGPSLPAMFCNDDATAGALLAAAAAAEDPLWRMPLWQPYAKLLESRVADLNNVSDGPYAGAVTAALFLERFVSPGRPWVHLDVMAWNTKAEPGRPPGGEAMAMRALYRMIADRFGG